MVDERLANAIRFFFDDLASAALGANKQNFVVGCRHLLDHVDRFVQRRQGVLEVDDVNLVARAEDEFTHLRIPVLGLVTEVSTCFQQVTHIDVRHGKTPETRVRPPRTPWIRPVASSNVAKGTRDHVPVHVCFQGLLLCNPAVLRCDLVALSRRASQ